MNKYFALRKANRMRTRLLTEKSQEQLKEWNADPPPRDRAGNTTL